MTDLAAYQSALTQRGIIGGGQARQYLWGTRPNPPEGGTVNEHPSAGALLMLSGGIDSTYCLWQRVQRGLATRTHHVVLKNTDDRHDVEATATADILEWLARNGGGELITHTESRMDNGDLLPLGLPDVHPMSYWAGVILFAEPSIKTIVIGGQRDDGGAEAISVYDWRFRGGAEAVARRPFDLVHPARRLSKADIIAALPPDLLALCWWCRRPQDSQPCHSCHTCALVDAAMVVR